MGKINKKNFSVYQDSTGSFSAKAEAGFEEVKLTVVRPSYKVSNEAQLVYNRKLKELVDGGTYLQAEIVNLLKERNLWTDDNQKQYELLRARIIENENWLTVKDDTKKTKEEGRKRAIQLRTDRMSANNMMDSYRNLEQNCAESQAENAKFNFLIYKCTLTEDGGVYFNDMSYDDYLENADPVLVDQAGLALMDVIFGLDDRLEADRRLPENKFLTKYKFCDDKLRLVNKDGHLVDTMGKLINEDGRYVNENDEFIDFNGNRVTEEGLPIVEEPEFVDE